MGMDICMKVNLYFILGIFIINLKELVLLHVLMDTTHFRMNACPVTKVVYYAHNLLQIV